MNKKATKNQKTQEIITGIKDLDSLFTGLEQNSIIVLGGKPERDVTNFLLNLLANLCINGKKCLFCTYGFWREELLSRLIRRELHNKFEIVIDSDFKNYLNFITNTLMDISTWNLHTFDLLCKDITSLEIEIKVLKPDYVFIDSYEDLKGVYNTDEEISCFIKDVTQKYNTGIFINTLLRRDSSEISPKIPTIFDLNVSKEVVKIANDIIIAYYYDYSGLRCRYVENEKRVIDITSVKRLNKSITLNYDNDTGKMW